MNIMCYDLFCYEWYISIIAMNIMYNWYVLKYAS